MNDADELVEAACSQIGFGCRGSGEAMPLPRCVLSRAPAATAAWIVGTVGGGVSQGDHDSGGGRAADELDRPGPLRRQSDQDDPAGRDAS